MLWLEIMKQVDDRFIGKGEKSALAILKKIFPSADIQIQFPFKNLMNEEFFGSLSDRQKKETLDIVVFQYANPTIVIRVQDKTHVGTMKQVRDTVQKKMLEWNDCKVVDLWFYECPMLWKEKVNKTSEEEIRFAFIDAGLDKSQFGHG